MKTEGWGWPLNANKAHYFPKGDIRSLCGRWLFAGERDPDEFPSEDDCSSCRKAVTKLAEPAPVADTPNNRARALDRELKYGKSGNAALPQTMRSRGAVGIQD